MNVLRKIQPEASRSEPSFRRYRRLVDKDWFVSFLNGLRAKAAASADRGERRNDSGARERSEDHRMEKEAARLQKGIAPGFYTQDTLPKLSEGARAILDEVYAETPFVPVVRAKDGPPKRTIQLEEPSGKTLRLEDGLQF